MTTVDIDYISRLQDVTQHFFNQELEKHEHGQEVDQRKLTDIYRSYHVTEILLLGYVHGLERKSADLGVLPSLLIRTSEELEQGIRNYLGGE